jgi:hypothetical protein
MRAIQALDKPALQCPHHRPTGSERFSRCEMRFSRSAQPNQNTDLAKQNQAREISVILPGLSLALEP